MSIPKLISILSVIIFFSFGCKSSGNLVEVGKIQVALEGSYHTKEYLFELLDEETLEIITAGYMPYNETLKSLRFG